jgi:hypothetical protein
MAWLDDNLRQLPTVLDAAREALKDVLADPSRPSFTQEEWEALRDIRHAARSLAAVALKLLLRP